MLSRIFCHIYALLLKLVPVFYVCTCEQKVCFLLMDMGLYDVKKRGYPYVVMSGVQPWL